MSCMTWLKAKIFALGEWYSCSGLALVPNSGVYILGFNIEIQLISKNEMFITRGGHLTEANTHL